MNMKIQQCQASNMIVLILLRLKIKATYSKNPTVRVSIGAL